MGREAGRIFLVCDDLMFSAGVREAAAAEGAALEIIDSEEKFEEALERLRPTLFLADLHHRRLGGEEAGELVRKLRADEQTRDAFAVAWGKHTEPGLLRSAGRAGFDRVMPRSLFVEEMPEIVRRAAARTRASA